MGQGSQSSPLPPSVSELSGGAQTPSGQSWRNILLNEREWGFESRGCRQSCTRSIQSEGLQAIQWFPQACPWDFRGGWSARCRLSSLQGSHFTALQGGGCPLPKPDTSWSPAHPWLRTPTAVPAAYALTLLRSPCSPPPLCENSRNLAITQGRVLTPFPPPSRHSVDQPSRPQGSSFVDTCLKLSRRASLAHSVLFTHLLLSFSC